MKLPVISIESLRIHITIPKLVSYFVGEQRWGEQGILPRWRHGPLWRDRPGVPRMDHVVIGFRTFLVGRNPTIEDGNQMFFRLVIANILQITLYFEICLKNDCHEFDGLPYTLEVFVIFGRIFKTPSSLPEMQPERLHRP